MNPITNQLVLTFGIPGAVAAILSSGIPFLEGKFWPLYFGTFALQFFAFWVYKWLISLYNKHVIQMEQAKIMKLAAKNFVRYQCSTCKKHDQILVSLDETEFQKKCDCGTTNKITIHVHICAVTTPQNKIEVDKKTYEQLIRETGVKSGTNSQMDVVD